MHRSLLTLLLGVMVSALTGCISFEPRTSPAPAFANARDAWKIGEAKSATVGDLVLAEGAEVRTGPAYELTRPLNFSMPGTLGVPFQCTLQPCVLEPCGIVRNQVLFAAPEGSGAATFDGKSVFLATDELGIRVDRKTGAMRLYCDNSRFNGTIPGFAVWTRAATEEERSAFKPTSCDRLFGLPRCAALRYSGASAGEVRFTDTRYRKSPENDGLIEIDSTEYRFDAPPDGRGEIAVRGALIELLSISPTEMRYIVRRGFGSASEREEGPVPAPQKASGTVALSRQESSSTGL